MKGGVKRGTRGKTELLVQLQSTKEGFSLFFSPAVAESNVRIEVY